MEKKKIKKIILGSALFIAISVITVFAVGYANNLSLKGVVVHLNDDDFHNFLQKKDIENALIEDRNLSLSELNRGNIDLAAMERIIKANPWVKAADVYISNDHLLQVKVEQRIPIARLFTQKGASYYIDEHLQIMPPAVGYSYPAVVFTNVKDIKNNHDSSSQQQSIAYLASFILNDTFWRHQITQVDVVNENQFVCYTLVGDQKIIIGDTSRLYDKFDNLFIFYKQVSNKLGWDKYTELDLRFGQQVVARPSLGWVAPKSKDTTVVLPDEIKSINEIITSLPENSVVVEEKVELPKPEENSKNKGVKTKKSVIQQELDIKVDIVKPASSKIQDKKEQTNTHTTTIKEQEKADKQQPKYKYPG